MCLSLSLFWMGVMWALASHVSLWFLVLQSLFWLVICSCYHITFTVLPRWITSSTTTGWWRPLSAQPPRCHTVARTTWTRRRVLAWGRCWGWRETKPPGNPSRADCTRSLKEGQYLLPPLWCTPSVLGTPQCGSPCLIALHFTLRCSSMLWKSHAHPPPPHTHTHTCSCTPQKKQLVFGKDRCQSCTLSSLLPHSLFMCVLLLLLLVGGVFLLLLLLFFGGGGFTTAIFLWTSGSSRLPVR